MNSDRHQPPGLADDAAEPSLEHSPLPPERRPPSWPKLAAGVALALALAAGAWYLFFRGDEADRPPPPPPEVELEAEAPPGTRSRQPEEEIELPPLRQSDPLVRELVERLSQHPRLASWLATDDLVRRFVVTVDNLAEGRSPAVHLRTLDPGTGFRTAGEEGELTIDPASYRRYDLLADAFASLDTEGAARLYRRLEPLIDEAYRDLGYPDRDFDDTLAAAIDRLLAVPAVEGEVRLVPQEGAYALADPRLENLSPAAKHLLRMGPANARRVQVKLRQLRQALELE